MLKPTRLNENAEIYQRREKQSEREKLKGMSFGKKISYLWEYYKLHALGIIIAVVFISYLMKTLLTPQIEPQLYIALINNIIEETALDHTTEELQDLLQIAPDKESVVINPSFYFNGSYDYEMNMRQVLMAFVHGKDVDIMIAPESEFSNYSYNGYYYPLSDLLPTYLYSSLTDKFYISDQEDNPKKTVYGLYVADTDLFRSHSLVEDPEDPYILGVLINTTHLNNSVEFIRYLFKK